ncbi:MAG: response regulator [Bacteroidales bacterium]|nr:response regulator [Bacteroidales bacterium]
MNRLAILASTSTLTLLIILTLSMLVILLFNVIRSRQRKHRMQVELQEAKDRFYTGITHEFRTPLTVIQSAAQNIMRHSPPDSVIHDDAANIIWYGNIVLNLINRILDTAKMVSGNLLAPEWKHGDVVPFITMICESYGLYAADKGIRIVYKPREESVEMDFVPDYLHKVLQNLITNGIKYSHRNSEIDVSSEVASNKFILCVTDRGIGMTPEQKSNIFKAFYQASDDCGQCGTGIGLPLAKLLLDAVGGNIEAFSLENEGTTFVVKLPLSHGSGSFETVDKDDWREMTMVMPEKPVQLQDDDSENVDAVRILIIEDSMAVARYMSAQLNPDYQFFFAANGEEGLRKATDLVPDLIITDILMPGIDGLALCRLIRSSELLHHIPIVMVSAKVTREDRIKGIEAGAEAYLEKPFHADELSIRVDKLLEQRNILREKYIRDLEDGEIGKTPEVASGDRAFMTRFVDLAMKRIQDNDVDLNTLAADLGFSRTQLNRKIKAISGMTTTGYIVNLRVRLAKSLLRSGENLTVNEISYRCGIDDVPYFITMFKKATGMTPTQYRRRRG